MSPLTAGERIALVAVVETSRIPGKARLLAALDRVRKECPKQEGGDRGEK